MGESGSIAGKIKKLKDKEKNRIKINLVWSGLRYLKEEIKKMSNDKKETEKPNEIVNIIEKILEFNR